MHNELPLHFFPWAMASEYATLIKVLHVDHAIEQAHTSPLGLSCMLEGSSRALQNACACSIMQVMEERG
jgi:hypothetical protein